MSLKSGFFNAVEIDDEIDGEVVKVNDREYGADFFTALLKSAFKNCVTPDSFVASVGSGLTVNLTAGKGFVDGVFFYDDSASTITCTAATGTRTDLIVAKLNVTARTVTLEVKAGTTTAAAGEVAIAAVTVTGSAVTAVSNYARINCLNIDIPTIPDIPGIYVQQAQPSSPATGDLWFW